MYWLPLLPDMISMPAIMCSIMEECTSSLIVF